MARFRFVLACSFLVLLTGPALASPSFSERVVVSDPDAEFSPKLQIDGAGLPRLAYLGPTGGLVYSFYVQSTGAFSDLPIAGAPHVAHDFALDQENGAHLVGASTGPADALKLRYWYRPPTGGAFTPETILDATLPEGLARFAMQNSLAIAVGDDGVVHIVYMLVDLAFSSATVHYARRSPAGTWTIANLASGFALGTSVAIDNAGVPWVAYYQADPAAPDAPWELKLLNRQGGSWSTENIASFDLDDDLPELSGAAFLLSGAVRPSLGFTADGTLHLAYTNGSLQYAVRPPGGAFTTETVNDLLQRLRDSGLRPAGTVLTGLGARLAISSSGANEVNLVFESLFYEDVADDPDEPDEFRLLDRSEILGRAGPADGPPRGLASGRGSVVVLTLARKIETGWIFEDYDAAGAIDNFLGHRATVAQDNLGRLFFAYQSSRRRSGTLFGDTEGRPTDDLILASPLALPISPVTNVPTANGGLTPSLKVSVFGEPIIAYYDSTLTAVKVAERVNLFDTPVWSDRTVESAGSVGTNPSLAVSSAGVPWVAYRDASNDEIRVARRINGNWTNESGVSNGENPSLAFLRGASSPGLAFFEPSATEAKFASRDSMFGVWFPTTIESSGDVGRNPSFAVNADNLRGLAYEDRSGADSLRFAQSTGVTNWSPELVDTTGQPRDPSLATFGAKFAVAYEDRTAGSLRYAYQNPGGNWISELVDPGTGDTGRSPSLAFDDRGVAHVVYRDNAGSNLRYARRAPTGSWDLTTLEAGATGFDPSLAIDLFGNLHLAYFSGAEGELRYRRLLYQPTNSAYHDWVGDQFGATQTNPLTVGDLADPDRDRLENILEFLLCSDPEIPHDRPPFIPKLGSLRTLAGLPPNPATDLEVAYLDLLADSSDPTAHLFLDIDLGDGDWQRYPLTFDPADGWQSSFFGISVLDSSFLFSDGGAAFAQLGAAYVLSEEDLGNDKWRLRILITTRAALKVRPFLVRAAALRH